MFVLKLLSDILVWTILYILAWPFFFPAELITRGWLPRSWDNTPVFVLMILLTIVWLSFVSLVIVIYCIDFDAVIHLLS